MCRKTEQSASAHAGKSNAAREVGQRRTRSLQFPHAKLTNSTGGIWQKNTRGLTRLHTKSVLSLHDIRKFVSANRLFQAKTRFKPLFFVRGSKVPPEQKQAVWQRPPEKNIYKYWCPVKLFHIPPAPSITSAFRMNSYCQGLRNAMMLKSLKGFTISNRGRSPRNQRITRSPLPGGQYYEMPGYCLSGRSGEVLSVFSPRATPPGYYQ